MSLVRSSAVMILIQVGGSALTAVNFFILAAGLAPADLGAWAILLTLSAVIIMTTGLGYNRAAMYYIAQGTFAVETVVVNGLVICGVLEALLLGLVRFSQPYLRVVFPDISFVLILVMVMSAPMQLFLIYLAEASLAANLLGVVVWSKGMPVLIYVGGCVILAVSGRLSLYATVAVFVGGMLVSAVTGLGYLILASNRPSAFRPNLLAGVKCLRYGTLAQVGEISQYLSNRVDLLLVGYWAGTVATGYYAMAVRLAEIVWYISNSIQLTLLARVAQLKDPDAKVKLVQRAVRYVLLVSALGALVIAASANPILRIFLPRYVPSVPLLLVLLPGTVAFAVFQIIVGGLLGEGRPAAATWSRFLLFCISLVFYVALIPMFGSVGASLGTTLAYGVGALVSAWGSARLGHFSPSAYMRWQVDDMRTLWDWGLHLMALFRRRVAGFGK